MKQDMNLKNLVHLDGFQGVIAHEFIKEFCERNPEVPADWFVMSCSLYYPLMITINIFTKEISRGHIFADDLFHTTVNKYADPKSFFDEDTRIAQYLTSIDKDKRIDWFFLNHYTCYLKGFLLCHDFCLNVFRYYEPLIKELYAISKTGGVVKETLMEGQWAHNILAKAIERDSGRLISYLEQKGRMPYLHLENNLQAVLARLPQERKPVLVPKFKPILTMEDSKISKPEAKSAGDKLKFYVLLKI